LVPSPTEFSPFNRHDAFIIGLLLNELFSEIPSHKSPTWLVRFWINHYGIDVV
jgi:hypothetical protein